MRVPRNRWPDNDTAQGVLFCAQLLRQLLSPESFESFRALSLDTPSRIRELQAVAEDIREQKIKRVALTPVVEELSWSLKRDPIVRRLCADELETLNDELLSPNTSEVDLIHRAGFISRTFASKYKELLEDEILESITDPRQKIRARDAVTQYASHLLNIGHSRSFLLNVVEQVFFSKDHRSAGPTLLKQFFRKADGKPKKYVTYVGLNPPLARHMAGLGGEVMFGRALPGPVQFAFSEMNAFDEDKRYAVQKISALDHYRAAAQLERVLNYTKSLANMAAQGMEFRWDTETFVIRSGAKSGQFVREAEFTHRRMIPTRQSNRRILKGVQTFSNQLIWEFTPPSASRLLNAISTASLSLDSPNMDNRLTSHWSAFEVFLSAPLPGNARISHYVDELAPCICLRYARNLAVALYDEMLISHRRQFNDVVKLGISANITDQHTSFAAILLLDSHRELRPQLFSSANLDPLGMHRMWKFAKDFEKPASAYAAIISHERRIRWQLHRIYRARNSLVHAGSSPRYIDSLVLNLVEYFRTAVRTVVRRAADAPVLSDVDTVVADLGVSYRSYLKFLESQKGVATWNEPSFLRVFGAQ